MFKTNNWPLLIDPQLVGNKFIKSMFKDNLVVVNLKQTDINNKIIQSLMAGQVLLIENIQNQLDNSINGILELNKEYGNKTINIFDKEIHIQSGFQLFITTQLQNPTFMPDVFIKTQVINFSVSMNGLVQQLLS